METTPVEYDTSVVPRFPDCVRLRPSMYIGDIGVHGLHYLPDEVMKHAIDTVIAGSCNAITVVLNADESFQVSDNGPGIPVDIIERLMTDRHMSAILSSSYTISSGFWKDWVSSVNALSEWLEVTVRQNSKVHRMRFERGLSITPLSVVGDCAPDEHGTTVTWLADKSIFSFALTGNGSLAYEPKRISQRLQELAYLLPGTRITFHNRRDDEAPVVYHSLNGVVDFVAALNNGKDVFPLEPAQVSDIRGDCQVEVAIQWSDSDTETIRSYANIHETVEWGTHVTGLRRAITRAINRFSLASQIGERKLTTVIAIQTPKASFNSSTGCRFTTPEIEGLVFSVIYAALKKRFEIPLK